MVCLGLFVAASFAELCDFLCEYNRKRMLMCIALGFLLSFPFSFATQVQDPARGILLAVMPVAVAPALVCGPCGHRDASSSFKARPEIPVRFLVAIIALCVTGNFFTGLVDSSKAAGLTWSVYWSTAVNCSIAIAVMVLFKLGISIQKILFWCWISFSLAFFAGVVMLAIPHAEWLVMGSDVVATFRVSMEFLLVALIAMVASKEGVRADGLMGLCFLLPVGCSILLRHVFASIISSFWNGAVDYLPALVLMVSVGVLFSQYSFANKIAFRDYFSPPHDPETKARESAIDAMCKGAGLTPREREVLGLIAKGYTMKAISERLVISQETARTHGRSVYRKLDVHSKQEILDRLSSLEMGEG